MSDASSLRLAIAAQAASAIAGAQESNYVHTIFIDAAAGIYDCDCSGFVSYLLQQVAPRHLAPIPSDPDAGRPLAADYYDFLAAQPTQTTQGWRQIIRLADARTGDLVAWRLPDTGHGDTGHVFVTAATPTRIVSATLRVPVHDASDIVHFDDTRGPPPEAFPTGIRSGEIEFQLNVDGSPAAFRFNGSADYTAVPIVIARPEPFSAD